METALLNERELLRLGFSRPSVAALRNIQRVTGTETQSTTIPDIDSSLLGVNSQISAITNDVDSLQSGLATTNTNVANLRRDLTTTQSALNAAESDIVDLQNEKEDADNKVASISSASTDEEYPTAKLLYDQLALLRPISSYVEMTTPAGTTSATLEDVAGATVNITTVRECYLGINCAFEVQTLSGAAASTIGVAVNIGGTDHDEMQRYLSGVNDQGLGAIVHRSSLLAAGTYTIKLRFRRVSGVATPGLNKVHFLVFSL